MTEFSVQVDQTFLDESLPELQAYLLSNELYWGLGCGVPRLTLGNILFALHRLAVAEPAEARETRQKVDAFKAQWRVAWEAKIARETESRLRLWMQFLQEQEHDEQRSRAHYAAAVRERAILQLLLKEFPEVSKQAALADLDRRLRAKFLPGEFVWEAIYLPVFPADEFWFLYGGL